MNFTKPFEISTNDEVRQIIDQLGHSGMAHIVTVNEDGKPISSFLPVDFVPDENGLGHFLLHLANGNEQLADLKRGGQTLIELMSPNQYISPSWFADRNRAPTNIHVAVQCYGHPEIMTDQQAKRDVLERQVNARESEQTNRWQTRELKGDGYERRLSAISMVKIPVEEAKASARLLQDESIENVEAVIQHLKEQPCCEWAIQLIRQANAERLERSV